MKPKEFNEAMFQFFKQTGGEGMENLHKIFQGKSTALLFQAFLSDKPITMKDVPLPEGTVHRAKKVLIGLDLIEVVGSRRDSGAGPPATLWQLKRVHYSPSDPKT